MADYKSLDRRRARQFRIAAVIVLLLGLAGADVAYWLGSRSRDLSDDPLMFGNEKAQAQRMGTLYGNQGVMIQQWYEDLKNPDTQAIIIVAAAALVAGGCFYCARLLDAADQR